MLLTAQNFGTYGRLLRLLIYSGQRLSQIQTLTAAHVDRGARTFTWNAEEVKGDEPHIIWYSDLTAALLEELPTEGWLLPAENPTKPFDILPTRTRHCSKRLAWRTSPVMIAEGILYLPRIPARPTYPAPRRRTHPRA